MGLTRQDSDIFRFLENQKQNRYYSHVINKHIENVRRYASRSGQASEVYFSYFKQKENVNGNKDSVSKGEPKLKMLDEKIQRQFGGIPANCRHIRSSFFIWRKQK